MKRIHVSKNSWLTLAAVALLAIIALLFFAPDDFHGRVLQQHDILQGLANGQETQQYQQQTGIASRWTNSLFSGMPTFQISPTYRANKLLGPLFAIYTLGLPSPANLLFAMMLGFFIMCLCMKMRWPLALFAAVAWGFSSYFIIIIGAGHIWKFVTLAYIPPTIGGIALLYRGKYLPGLALTSLFASLQLQANHPQMTYYFLIPIILLVAAMGVILYRENNFRQWINASMLALCAALLALGANSASLYNSLQYSKETTRGNATYIRTENHDDTGGMDRAAITSWSYGIDETLTLLIPNVKGGATIKPEAGHNALKSVADTDAAMTAPLTPQEYQVVQSFPQYFGDQPMTNGPVYVGAFVLLLAILGLLCLRGKFSGPLKWALFAAMVLSIILAWGHNFPAVTNFFIDHVPGYNKFRTPSSILVVLEFCVPLLAAMCLAQMISTPDWLARNKYNLYAVFGSGALLCLAGWISPSIFGSGFSIDELDQLKDVMADPAYQGVLSTVRKGRLSLVSADCARSLMYILIGFLIIWLYLRKAFTSKAMFLGALTVVMAIDLFSVNKRYVDSDNFTDPAPEETTFAMTQADRDILADTTYYRVADLQDFNGARSSYFHHSIGGYHAAKLTRYNDLLTYQLQPAVRNLMANAQSNVQALQQNQENTDPDSIPTLFTIHYPALDMLNTKYYMAGDYAEENPHATGNAWFVENLTPVESPNEEMQALSTLDVKHHAVAERPIAEKIGKISKPSEGAGIILTSYAPNKLTYRSENTNPGLAIFSEVYFPWGWKAEVDGHPAEIFRVNYLLRAISLPAGTHEITMEFNPESLKVTNIIGLCCVILIYALCIVALTLALMPLIRKK